MKIYTNDCYENSLLAGIQTLENIHIIDIASPFLTDNSYLKTILNQKMCSIRLIIKLCEQTPISLLKKLLAFENIKIRFFMENSFHAKLYIFNKEYAIIGSSNFTQGGLIDNLKEINIGLSKNDYGLINLIDIFERYWDEAEAFTTEILEIYINEKNGFKPAYNDNTGEFNKKLKEAIENLNKKKKLKKRNPRRNELSPESRQNWIDIVKKSLSKPVVCLNTGQEYSSITLAAESKYGNRRAYGHISDVCSKKKSWYKRDVWRFADEYASLSKDKINFLIEAAKPNFKEDFKDRTKYLIHEKTFERQKQLIDYLNNNYNYGITRQWISQKKRRAEKENINFFSLKINEEEIIIYFAEYIQIVQKNEVIEEVPLGKEIKEIKKYYEMISPIQLGDCTVGQVLESQKTKFYKLDGEYYFSRDNISKYDCILSCEEIIKLIKNKEYILLSDLTEEYIQNSKKKNYYRKGNYLFSTINDYYKNKVYEISKSELLYEIELWFNKKLIEQ